MGLLLFNFQIFSKNFSGLLSAWAEAATTLHALIASPIYLSTFLKQRLGRLKS